MSTTQRPAEREREREQRRGDTMRRERRGRVAPVDEQVLTRCDANKSFFWSRDWFADKARCPDISSGIRERREQWKEEEEKLEMGIGSRGEWMAKEKIVSLSKIWNRRLNGWEAAAQAREMLLGDAPARVSGESSERKGEGLARIVPGPGGRGGSREGDLGGADAGTSPRQTRKFWGIAWWSDQGACS